MPSFLRGKNLYELTPSLPRIKNLKYLYGKKISQVYIIFKQSHKVSKFETSEPQNLLNF